MANPPAFGDPDRMTSANYYTGSGDNGGVHYNSGINNKAVYLMTDGGTFNGKTVSPLGIAKVADIYYEVQSNMFVSGSDYADLYDLLYQACLNLVGSEGITPADCETRANPTSSKVRWRSSMLPKWGCVSVTRRYRFTVGTVIPKSIRSNGCTGTSKSVK